MGCLEKEAWHYLNRHWIYLIGCSSCLQSTIKNMLPKGHKFPTENTGRSNLGNLTASFLPWQKYPRQMCMLSCCLNFLHCESIPLDDEGFCALKLIYLFIHSFIYLFLYNLRQEAWITHRASSTTSSRKKKQTNKKISNTTNKNDNFKKRQKKKCKCRNRIGEDIDKKTTTHTIEQAVQWPTSVALNTHTLKGLTGVDIINRLSEIQVVRQ